MSIEAIRQARNDVLAQRASRDETFAAQVTCGARDLFRAAAQTTQTESPPRRPGWVDTLLKLGAIGSAREVLETACTESRRGEVSRETLKATVGGVAAIATKAGILAGGALALGGTALTGGSAALVVGAAAAGFIVLPKVARAITDFAIDKLDDFSKRVGVALRERSERSIEPK
jgi:hypothetical protein